MNLADKYQAEVDRLSCELETVKAELKPLNQKMSNLNHELASAKSDLATARSRPRISDHAVIRYLERVHGFSFDDQRRALMTADVVKAIMAGCTKIKRDGYDMIVKDHTIVTIVDKS